jgi:hypothetical protein
MALRLGLLIGGDFLLNPISEPQKQSDKKQYSDEPRVNQGTKKGDKGRSASGNKDNQ